MENVTSLLNTSVADAKSSLECQLLSNPAKAGDMATACLDILLVNNDGRHMSRIAMLRTIISKARKQLSQ